MEMWYTLLVITLICCIVYIIYLKLNRSNIDIEEAVKKTKEHVRKSLVREIVFYHDHYNGSEQLSCLARWIWCVKDKIKNAPEHEKKMFKEIVNSL